MSNETAQHLPCTHDEVVDAVAAHWPTAAARHGIDATDPDAPRPCVDGGTIRMFSLPGIGREEAAASYAALDDMMTALDASGYVVVRGGGRRHVLGRKATE